MKGDHIQLITVVRTNRSNEHIVCSASCSLSHCLRRLMLRRFSSWKPDLVDNSQR